MQVNEKTGDQWLHSTKSCFKIHLVWPTKKTVKPLDSISLKDAHILQHTIFLPVLTILNWPNLYIHFFPGTL
jgi:hypothetical protein